MTRVHLTPLLAQCQVALRPWPVSGVLLHPLAYAHVAVPVQRLLHALASFSFIGACDLHAVAPRLASATLVALYAAIIATLVLELPTDVALSVRCSNPNPYPNPYPNPDPNPDPNPNPNPQP